MGSADELLVEELGLEQVVWAAEPWRGPIEAQCSAHGATRPATVEPRPGDRATVSFARPARGVAPGQSVVFYDGAEVVGGGIVA
jgi:tRNA-specific 2-thiouridylase